MNIRNLSLGLIALVVFALLMILTINSRYITHKNYENWQQTIRMAGQIGSKMDTAVLSNRVNRYADYDQISRLSREMYESELQIKKLSTMPSGLLNPVLVLDASGLIETIEMHRLIALDFQTELSALNSATTVFLGSVQELIWRSEQAGLDSLILLLLRLEERLLIHSEDNFENKSKDISRLLLEIEVSFPHVIQENPALWSSIVDDSKSVIEHARNLDLIVISEKAIRNKEMELITPFFTAISEARITAQYPQRIMEILLVIELLMIALFYIARSRKLGKEIRSYAESLEETVAERTASLESAIEDLHKSSDEKEKLAEDLRVAQRLEAIGQLAAGIAHEINTPTQFVSDNLNFMSESFEDRSRLFEKYKEALECMASHGLNGDLIESIRELEDEIDLEFLEEEVPLAMKNSLEGVNRISKIVKSMKDFSHPGADGQQNVDINKALETTLNVAKNEWKYVSTIEKNFMEDLPTVPAYASELNQVLLNIIVNSAHAIEKKQKDTSSDELGIINIKTESSDECVSISIRDNGCGIPQENIDRVFDPFFTTKEVGKGTGQGLSIARKIIVDKHKGSLLVNSEPGEFTEFKIRLLINQANEVENDGIPLAQAS